MISTSCQLQIQMDMSTVGSMIECGGRTDDLLPHHQKIHQEEMEDIQVMVTGVTQAMVMEDIQTIIKITGTLETVSELLEATKSKIRQSHSEHDQFQY